MDEGNKGSKGKQSQKYEGNVGGRGKQSQKKYRAM
jgi:hypothetical protein